MKLNRRSFFAALSAAPVIAKAAPKVEAPRMVIDNYPAMTARNWELSHPAAYTPTAKQRELIDAPEREILFTGGRGAGMTYGSAMWLEQCGDALWIVESHAGSRDRLDLFNRTHTLRESDLTATGESGSRIRMATPERLDTLPGLRFDRIAFDIPADQFPFDLYATLRDRHPHAKMLVATAPPMSMARGFDWLAK